MDQRVGTLEAGKDADIAIFTGNPMEVFTKTLYTIIDGQIIYNGMKDDDEFTLPPVSAGNDIPKAVHAENE